MSSSLVELAGTAQHLADVAARALQDCAGIAFEFKADGTPVTPFDRAVEHGIRTEIRRLHPDHGIVGEEFGAENEDRDHVWIIDPIDGTRQFSAGLPNFGTLIALCRGRTPVIGVILQPWTNLVCIGVEGLGTRVNGEQVRTAEATDPARVIACLSDPDAFDNDTQAGFEAVQKASLWNVYDGGCLGYASLARGLVGLNLNGPNLEPFDIAALIPVVRGAGGVISDWRGDALDAHSSGAIVASANPGLHDRVLALLA